MNKISAHNKSLLYLLLFTIISSAMAYVIIIRAYDNIFALSSVEAMQMK